jgi:glyoxalase family protein
MERFLTQALSFQPDGEQRDALGRRLRFRGSLSDGSTVDLVENPDLPQGAMGAGSIHHLAFRAPDDEVQQSWQKTLLDMGVGVTPVKDRQYFQSIYFQSPAGALFEIATDPPGFTIDEEPAALGTGLKLPPWYEDRRREIEAALPALERRRVSHA